jgi:hypothetical protein
VKNLFWQIILAFCLLLKAKAGFVGSGCGLHFLSDAESNVFFEKFLQNRNLGDFALRIKLESFSRQYGHIISDGVVLHRRINGSSAYYVEIADGTENSRKFLMKDGKILTNFSGYFNPNEPFIVESLYTPNDILFPFLNPNCRFKYFGPKKVCGRTTQQFIVQIDGNLLGPDIKYVRVSIDSVFFQALEIEYLNDKRKFVSRQRILSLCRRNDYWQLKTLELFNIATRERSKVTIVDSDFNPEFGDVFSESNLRLQHSLAQR